MNWKLGRIGNWELGIGHSYQFPTPYCNQSKHQNVKLHRIGNVNWDLVSNTSSQFIVHYCMIKLYELKLGKIGNWELGAANW